MSDHADTKEFTLKKPIKFADGTEVKSVTLREPTGYELERAESEAIKAWRIENQDAKKDPQVSGTNINMQIIAQVSTPRLTIAAVRSLCARDFTAMRNFIGDFLSDSEAAETGES